jgi:general secretion pathway protein I
MRSHAKHPRRDAGFTLIEVMVALAIVALSVPALLLTLDQQIDGTAYLRDRSLAQIVASNRLSELRLALRTGPQSLRGRISGSEEMAGRKWFWSMQSQATDVPGFSRVELKVSGLEAEDSASLYTLVAFIAANAEPSDGG